MRPAGLGVTVEPGEGGGPDPCNEIQVFCFTYVNVHTARPSGPARPVRSCPASLARANAPSRRPPGRLPLGRGIVIH